MGGCDAEFKSVWKIWSSTATASGKLWTKDLKKCQHTHSNDGDVYALNRACGGTRSKLLPNVLPKLLSSQSHSVYAGRSVDGESKKHVRIWT